MMLVSTHADISDQDKKLQTLLCFCLSTPVSIYIALSSNRLVRKKINTDFSLFSSSFSLFPNISREENR